MARVYPKQLPKHVLENPKLSSEVRVYERIRDKVPGDFTCYYSRSWHEADDHGAEFDGEADFIVAHAVYGLLFLEVKGGRVSCRETDGQPPESNRQHRTGEQLVWDPEIRQSQDDLYLGATKPLSV